MKIDVVLADYFNPVHQAAILSLLESYALDPMGGNMALPISVKETLIPQLQKLPHAFSVLAFYQQQAVGLVNCFEGFSTFAAKPLVNIHDVIVLDSFRGQGVARSMLNKVEDHAKSQGCCKLTLEVLSGNEPAKAAYLAVGFAGYELDPEAGQALFWQKKLD